MSEQSPSPIQANPSNPSESTHADRLRAVLKRAGLSQRAAARMLEIDERTVRQWCAGQGAPSESVYRALSPKVAHLEDLRRRIEMNEQFIGVLESGQFADIPRDYRPRDAVAAKQEIEHLRRRNEEHRALLRLEEAIDWKREAHAVIFDQWLPRGNGMPTDKSLDDLEAAEREFQAAKADVDRITAKIRNLGW